jgi:hypothetical protein
MFEFILFALACYGLYALTYPYFEAFSNWCRSHLFCKGDVSELEDDSTFGWIEKVDPNPIKVTFHRGCQTIYHLYPDESEYYFVVETTWGAVLPTSNRITMRPNGGWQWVSFNHALFREARLDDAVSTAIDRFGKQCKQDKALPDSFVVAVPDSSGADPRPECCVNMLCKSCSNYWHCRGRCVQQTRIGVITIK